MARDSLDSSVRDIVREIKARIRFHEQELVKLTKLLNASETMLGNTSVSPNRSGTIKRGLKDAILGYLIKAVDSDPHVEFTAKTIMDALNNGWSAHSVQTTLHNMVKDGTIKDTGKLTTKNVMLPGNDRARKLMIYSVK